MSTTFLIVQTYMGIFVNLYIWQKHTSISELCWYNMVMFVAWGIGFTVGASSLTRFASRLPMRLSALSGMTAFLILSLLKLPNDYLWIACVAVPAGLFGGFYYSGQNLTIARLGRGEEFSAFYFYQNLINQVVGLVNPILSALVIHWFGYESSFILMFVLGCIMFGISFIVPKVTYKADVASGGRFYQHIRWQEVFSTPSLRIMHAGLFVGGLFFQFQAALALILTFSVTGSKILIGILSMGYTLACVVALRLYQRVRIDKKKWMTIGIGLIVIGFVLAAFSDSSTRIISNFLTTVGMFYFSSVWNAQQYSMFSTLPPMHIARIFTWRENTFNVSRLMVYGALFPLHQLTGVPFYVILGVMVVTSIFVSYFQNKSISLAAIGSSTQPATATVPPTVSQ